MKLIISFIVGLIFSLGLGLSGMTQVQTVKGFLDITGDWNPALIGVMVGAIAVHSVAYFFIRKRTTPVLDKKFFVPTRKDMDKKLFFGAALFGIGWGWGGICPGPGIVSLMSGDHRILIFIISMLIGMFIFKTVENKLG